MDVLMGSDIFLDAQDCECGGEAPPAFNIPPPPPPPGFHYLEDPHKDALVETSSTPLPWTCPVLINAPQHYEDSLFSAVAATCVGVLLLLLVAIVTIASRRRYADDYYTPTTYNHPEPYPATKPASQTPSDASYASMEPNFPVGYFSSTPIRSGPHCPSPPYSTPCSPSPSRVFLSNLSPYSPLCPSPITPSPLSPSPSPSTPSHVLVRYHTSSHGFGGHSLARPHTFARTQPAHPRRSPLYRPRLAKVVSGQLLVLPSGELSPCFSLDSPLSPDHRAVDNLYSPLPPRSTHTAFVFP